MKTSNKLIAIGVFIIISFPIIQYFTIKNIKKTELPTVKYHWEYIKDSISTQKLSKYKHIKVIGNKEVLSNECKVLFMYDDSYYAFADNNLLKDNNLFSYNKDTLIVNLNQKDTTSYKYVYPICLHAPVLESVSSHQSMITINTLSKHMDNTSIIANLHESTLIFDTKYFNEIYKQYQKLDREMSYQKITLNGIDSKFDLSNIKSNEIELNLKGKSLFKSMTIFNNIYGTISKETIMDMNEKIINDIKDIKVE